MKLVHIILPTLLVGAFIQKVTAIEVDTEAELIENWASAEDITITADVDLNPEAPLSTIFDKKLLARNQDLTLSLQSGADYGLIVEGNLELGNISLSHTGDDYVNMFESEADTLISNITVNSATGTIAKTAGTLTFSGKLMVSTSGLNENSVLFSAESFNFKNSTFTLNLTDYQTTDEEYILFSGADESTLADINYTVQGDTAKLIYRNNAIILISASVPEPSSATLTILCLLTFLPLRHRKN